MKRIAIIGGGAAGLICASKLSQNNQCVIDIFEKSNKVGHKILISGNGKCNLTNINVNKYKYNNPEFIDAVLGKNSTKELQDEFLSLGLLTKIDEEGRVYPYSESSNSVLDVLLSSLNNNNVSIFLNSEIRDIKVNNKYYINNLEYDYLVIASGSRAMDKGEDSAKKALNKLGLVSTKLAPALTPINVKEDLKSLKGIRSDAKATLYIDKEKHESTGEILFKDNSISGIAIFELSSFLARSKVKGSIKECTLSLDLMPEYSNDELEEILEKRVNDLKELNAEFFLRGIFNKMLNQKIYKRAGLDIKKKCINITKKDIEVMISIIKNFSFAVDLDAKNDICQVYSGGIEVNQVNNKLESLTYKNMYIAGETLDVDGVCGGYNLHFAFYSGLVIAKDILGK